MTTAETIRAAAVKLREAAEAADEDGKRWETYPLPDAGPNRWTMTGVGVVGDDMGHRAEVLLPVYAAYIATVHPAFGLAVADLLEYLAGFEEEMNGTGTTLPDTSRWKPHGWGFALAVARVVLGDEEAT